MQSDPAVIEMKGITKKFGDFTANSNIDLTVHKGQVHALLGENGAGKTTLMNQLYGLYRPTAGEIWLRGKRVDITDSNVAIAHGIGMVHQHFMLIQPFTVADNIVLGQEIVRGPGVLDRKKAVQTVQALSREYGLEVDPGAKICDISVGMQQRVEILKVLYRGADILIFDEPTAVLTPQEIEEFAAILHRFTQSGKTVIIITHKLGEIMQMADVCTIIRRGTMVGTVEVAHSSEEELAQMMVGRNVSFSVDKQPRQPGGVVLDIQNLHVRDRRAVKVLDGLSLQVRKGEIVGIAGVDGNGQTELVEAMMGLCPVESGRITVDGQDVTGKNMGSAVACGVGSIPADRQKHGLSPNFTVPENLIMKQYNRPPFAKRGILQFANIQKNSDTLVDEYDIRTPGKRALAKNLSGGNQQKVIIAREISCGPDLLIASQPTRGLDVGAIEFIHKEIVGQRNQDRAVLLISFELDEVLDLSDRIAVIYEGKIVAVLDADKTGPDEVGLLMAGGKQHG